MKGRRFLGCGGTPVAASPCGRPAAPRRALRRTRNHSNEGGHRAQAVCSITTPCPPPLRAPGLIVIGTLLGSRSPPGRPITSGQPPTAPAAGPPPSPRGMARLEATCRPGRGRTPPAATRRPGAGASLPASHRQTVSKPCVLRQLSNMHRFHPVTKHHRHGNEMP